MTFGAAISEHPLATQATGEVVGEVLERVGEAPDLAVLFVTPPHLGLMAEIAETVRTVLRPGTLLGAAASTVVGGPREVEEGPAISLWAGRVGPVEPVRLETQRLNGGWALTGLPAQDDDAPPRTLLLLTDPFTIPMDGVLRPVAGEGARPPGGRRHGLGRPRAGRQPAGPRRRRVRPRRGGRAAGVVGRVRTVVSQGCRPVGQAYVVTRATDDVIQDLAGVPALDRLREIVGGRPKPTGRCSRRDCTSVRSSTSSRTPSARATSWSATSGGPTPRPVTSPSGGVAPVGSTVQFHVRDAESADEDLRHLLAGQDGRAALVFTCSGRGSHLFGEPDHDAGLVDDQVARGAVAGMFCAGELGPIGGRNFVHTFTASVVLFDG